MNRRMTERAFETVGVVRAIAEELGRSPAHVALNWVMSRPDITVALMGARTVQQVDDNLGALGWQLEEEHLARLDAASRINVGYPQEFQRWMAAVGM
jgi:aryl-alcohol dehydrogenase-like predicted oxidoreductase